MRGPRAAALRLSAADFVMSQTLREQAQQQLVCTAAGSWRCNAARDTAHGSSTVRALCLWTVWGHKSVPVLDSNIARISQMRNSLSRACIMLVTLQSVIAFSDRLHSTLKLVATASSCMSDNSSRIRVLRLRSLRPCEQSIVQEAPAHAWCERPHKTAHIWDTRAEGPCRSAGPAQKTAVSAAGRRY